MARASCLLALLALAACRTEGPRDYVEFRARLDPFNTAQHIAENVGACWFAGDRAEFAGYSYAPELASVANRPRVLIVPKDDPTGLPRLVIEASRGERGARVKLFGPLMGGGAAAMIRRDVERWAGGGSGCA